MKQYRLTIKRPGSLLSKVLDRDISEDELQTIRIVLDNRVQIRPIVLDHPVRKTLGFRPPEGASDAEA